MLPAPPGEEATEAGSPIEIGAEEESSIIITACRRLAPAPMSIGVSGNVPEEGEEGKGSARNVDEGGTFVDCVVNWKASLGNRCFRVAERGTFVGGGEGEGGSEGDWVPG